ncbi:MAG: phosphoribosylformylglycinamidine synthase subunit PurQ [Holophagales bacterium]|nr:phosphoribosylformylglycinamidine synthase subunit PurQ [Holophagales bacterium]
MSAGARPRVSVIVFPGSNCDHDAANAVEETIGAEARLIWHARTNLENPDLVILPGGFSYGDYLRCGALARFSPVMEAVRDFAAKGGAVLGICNGFQVLCEAGLLPGALLLNSGQRFRCEDVFVRVETIRTPFTAELTKGDVLRLPIAHGDGNWRAEAEAWDDVTTHDQVVFRYCDAAGGRGTGANPNGSLDDVAGVCNRERNVVGLMPHPERASETLLGNTDGARLFRSFANGLLLGRTS